MPVVDARPSIATFEPTVPARFRRLQPGSGMPNSHRIVGFSFLLASLSLSTRVSANPPAYPSGPVQDTEFSRGLRLSEPLGPTFPDVSKRGASSRLRLRVRITEWELNERMTEVKGSVRYEWAETEEVEGSYQVWDPEKGGMVTVNYLVGYRGVTTFKKRVLTGGPGLEYETIEAVRWEAQEKTPDLFKIWREVYHFDVNPE